MRQTVLTYTGRDDTGRYLFAESPFLRWAFEPAAVLGWLGSSPAIGDRVVLENHGYGVRLVGYEL